MIKLEELIKTDKIKNQDWPEIMKIQVSCYEDAIAPEPLEVLKSKWEVSKETCCVLKLRDRIIGYSLALPYPKFRFPSLIKPETEKFDSDNLCYHDISIKKEFSKKGYSRYLLRQIVSTAISNNFKTISIVSIGKAVLFNKKLGLTEFKEIPVPEYYGKNAVYMHGNIEDLQIK